MSERIIYYPDTNVNAWGEAREFIVRCRDCKHWSTWDMSAMYQDHDHDRHACFRIIDGFCMETDADGFCAWGERRDA